MARENARRLRTNATGPERVLWTQLRFLKADGFHFRRQAPVGIYIADFACHSARLIVELDGGQHSERDAIRYDEQRTAWLESQGYEVVRVWNDEVLRNLHGVVLTIREALRRRGPPTPAPPHQGEGN